MLRLTPRRSRLRPSLLERRHPRMTAQRRRARRRLRRPGSPTRPWLAPDDPASGPRLSRCQPATPDPAELGRRRRRQIAELSSDWSRRRLRTPLREARAPGTRQSRREAVYDARQRALGVAGLGDRLTSDPTQFTYPVYEMSADTDPRWPTSLIDGLVLERDGRRANNGQCRTSVVGADADTARGGGRCRRATRQVILVNPETGEEWGAWRFRALGSAGVLRGRQRVPLQHAAGTAVPPPSSGRRRLRQPRCGRPVPGRSRCGPARSRLGSIEHALAFAYDSPSGDYVYPATKSDGDGSRRQTRSPRGSAASTRSEPHRPRIIEASSAADGPCRTVARGVAGVRDGRDRQLWPLEGDARVRRHGRLGVEPSMRTPSRRCPSIASTCARHAHDSRATQAARSSGTEARRRPGRQRRSADVICGLDGNDELRGLGRQRRDLRGARGATTRILGGDGQDATRRRARAPTSFTEVTVATSSTRAPESTRSSPAAVNDRLLAAVTARPTPIDGGLGSDEAELDDERHRVTDSRIAHSSRVGCSKSRTNRMPIRRNRRDGVLVDAAVPVGGALELEVDLRATAVVDDERSRTPAGPGRRRSTRRCSPRSGSRAR